MLRELEEETGLTAGEVEADSTWCAALTGARIAMFKPVRAGAPAAELRERMLAHIAAEKEPELAGIRIARGPADLDPMMPNFVSAFLTHMWNGADP